MFVAEWLCCPILNLERLLGFDTGQISDEGTLSVLVFQMKDRFFGFVVAEIVDIVSTNAEIDTGIADRIGISGNLFIGDKTVSVINLEKVV